MPRKERTKLVKQNIDLLKPVDFTNLGTENDPCFGKLFDPGVAECSRCGDSELCHIKQSQNQRITRNKLERENSYKDVPEGIVTRKELSHFIRVSIKKRSLPITVIRERAMVKFSIKELKFDTMLEKILLKTKRFRKENNSLIYIQ